MRSLHAVSVILFHLVSVVVFTSCYTCNNGEKEYGNVSHSTNGKWPNGIVKYKLHSSLSADDKVEVQKAFEEYQRKTCIRFQPWQEGDKDYTSIETDNSICGLGHLCKQGGYQYAKFGGNCRESSTLIHELGHNLCLYHENERVDRDEYVNYEECEQTPPKRDNATSTGLYDYDSQMHLRCEKCSGGRAAGGGGGWPKNHVSECGSDVTEGLSLLDVDKINALYECQGCHRHRWRPITSLTSDDKSNMYHFGYYGKRGSRLFPCRGYVEGELAIGKYDDSKNICYISYGSTVKKLTSEAEVLTIPGGLSRGGFSYKLISSDRYSDSELIRIAVPAGRVGRIPFDTERGVGYIAYTTFFEDNGVKVDSIGKVWNRAGELNVAHFPHGPAEKLVSDEEFYVLACSKD